MDNPIPKGLRKKLRAIPANAWQQRRTEDPGYLTQLGEFEIFVERAPSGVYHLNIEDKQGTTIVDSYGDRVYKIWREIKSKYDAYHKRLEQERLSETNTRKKGSISRLAEICSN